MLTESKKNTDIILGLVTPLGTETDKFSAVLEKLFNERDFHFERIKLTDLLFNNKKNSEITSFKMFAKMEFCNKLRNGITLDCDSRKGVKISAFMACLAINEIAKRRKKERKKKIVYLIDQIKNVSEYHLLSHVYGRSYIQISLFSREKNRDDYIRELIKRADKEINLEKDLKTILYQFIKQESITLHMYENRYLFDEKKINYNVVFDEIIEEFNYKIDPDDSHNLIEKDFIDTSKLYKENKTGQQVADIFHLSHYFFDADRKSSNQKRGIKSLEEEVQKFITLLFGQHKEHPTQDEFGMSLAFQGKVRSNFPGGRQVGAAILSKHGEVISVASIRAPSLGGYANPNKEDEDKIRKGYEYFCKQLEKHPPPDYLKPIDFHPCSHAEISALLDAAKLGVSVRDATLYTTTFPCHICAKDIVNAGIARVVYLEAYPKSKNKELYGDIIDIEGNYSKNKLPFDFFVGVGYKRYGYVYSMETKDCCSSKDENKTNDEGLKNIPQYLWYEDSCYFEKRENDILNAAYELINEKKPKYDFLNALIKGEKK